VFFRGSPAPIAGNTSEQFRSHLDSFVCRQGQGVGGAGTVFRAVPVGVYWEMRSFPSGFVCFRAGVGPPGGKGQRAG
jgi:hypothetical protein